MTKIYCADCTCAFNNDQGVCTQNKVALSYHSVMTQWDGRQEYLRCHMYEQNKRHKKMEDFFKGKCNEQTDDRGSAD